MENKKKSNTLLIMLIIFGVLFVGVSTILVIRLCSGSSNSSEVTYQLKDINEMYDSTITNYSSNDAREDNLDAFNILLKFADKEIGKGKYYLASIYEVNYGKITKNGEDKVSTYVIKVVPKEYEKEFNDYGKNDSLNPYLVMYSIKKDKIDNSKDNSYDNYVESYYPSLVVGLKYEKQIKEYFNNLNKSYNVNVWFNPYFHSRIAKTVDEKPNISVDDKHNEATAIYLFVPSTSNIETIKTELSEKKNEIKNMGIKQVTICLLNSNVNIDNTDFSKINEFSDEVDKTEDFYTVQ